MANVLFPADPARDDDGTPDPDEPMTTRSNLQYTAQCIFARAAAIAGLLFLSSCICVCATFLHLRHPSGYGASFQHY